MTGANCLVAIYGEKDSPSLEVLNKEAISRLDVVNFIAHGILKNKVTAEPTTKAVFRELEEAAVLNPVAVAVPRLKQASGQKLFISYSHSDVECLKRLLVHLRPLTCDNGIACWSDKRMNKWRHEIQSNLDQATVAILLISADFLASEFIVNNELPPLLIKAESVGLRILPLILKPCGFRRDPILETFPKRERPCRAVARNESHRTGISLRQTRPRGRDGN